MIEKIQILVPRNEVPDANGNVVDVSEDFIDEIQKTYDPNVHEAPLVIGHDSDSIDEMPDWVPAYGWVKKLIRGADGSLYAVVDIADELKDFVKKKFYKKVSAAIYSNENKISPVEGKNYLRHIAFLGASPPAIKGLEQFQFAEKNNLVISLIEDINIQTEQTMPGTSKNKILKEKKGKPLSKEEMDKLSADKSPELEEDEKTVELAEDEDTELKEHSKKKKMMEEDKEMGEKNIKLQEDEDMEMMEKDVKLGGMKNKKDKEVVELQEEEEEEEEAVAEDVETPVEEEEIVAEDEAAAPEAPETLETPEEAVDFLNQNASDFLRFIIAEGDKGYKGEITRFDPSPVEENNWLYDPDTDSYTGSFIDESLGDAEFFTFEIKRDGEEWVKSFRVVDTPEDPALAPQDAADEEEELELAEDIEFTAEEDKDLAFGEGEEYCEGCGGEMYMDKMGDGEHSHPKLKKEIHTLKLMLAKTKMEMMTMKKKMLGGFVDSMYEEARLTEGMVDKEDMKIFLNSLESSEMTTLQFSENVGEKNQLEFVKDLLRKLPPQVNFGETKMPTVEDDVQTVQPIGSVADPERDVVHKQVLSYIKAEGLDPKKDYQDALKQILRKGGMI